MAGGRLSTTARCCKLGVIVGQDVLSQILGLCLGEAARVHTVDGLKRHVLADEGA